MEMLSLVLAVVFSFQGATQPGSGFDETRAVIIDTGAPGAEAPPANNEARSQIIDTGNY